MPELRRTRLTENDTNIQVNVCGEIIDESTDEKLLGVTISNNLSWKTYLYGNGKTGDEKLVGLTTQLSQRVGILSKIAKVTTSRQFSNMCQGMFTSRLLYCIQLFGNVWGIPDLDDENRRSTSFTKEDNRRLQVIQNRMARLKTKLGRDTPTSTLLSSAGELSVNQHCAFQTLMLVFKVVTSQYPRYLADRLKLRKPIEGQMFNPRLLNTIRVPNANLSASKSAFFVRGASPVSYTHLTLPTNREV